MERSLDEVRRECTQALRGFGESDYAVVPVRATRAACRRFRDDAAMDLPHKGWGGRGPGEGSAGFFPALGALRAAIGQQVAALVAHYDLEVEGDLASVLPGEEEEGEGR